MTHDSRHHADLEKAPIHEEVRDATMMIMPWAVSALLHLGVVLLSAFVVWSTTETAATEDDQIIIPRISDYREGTPLLLESAADDAGARSASSASLSMAVAPSASPGRSDARRIGAEQGVGATGDRAGRNGDGDALGARGWGGVLSNASGPGGRRGKASPFDSGGTGQGPGTGIFIPPSRSGNARSFVFLIDASGSLIDTLPFVILELNRFIAELREHQSFNVIFFQGDEPIEVPVPRAGLKAGTVDNKTAAIKWMDPRAGHVVPQGKSNPLPALKLALSQNPDVLFILSDNITGQGIYQVDQRQLIEAIDHRISGRKTKISTVQFIYPDPLGKVGMKPTLQLIAEQFGGEYRFVDGRELGIE